jgi:hypothetical protein
MIMIANLHRLNVKHTNNARLNASGKRSKGIKLFVRISRFLVYIARRKFQELTLLIMKITNVREFTIVVSVV